jgi:hypothetical protein
MPPRITQEEFIFRAVEKYGNHYDYSEFIYLGADDKGKVICTLHGSFLVLPWVHINGRECLLCSKETQIQQAFLEANKAHNYKFDYSKFEYKNKMTSSSILCPIHGEFKQALYHHIVSPYGCPGCSPIIRNRTTQKFINEANIIHNYRFDYSKSIFSGYEKKIEIICQKHGSFWQKAGSHLKGLGCRFCSGRFTKSTEQFIKDAINIHGDKYDYTCVEYTKAVNKVKIKCKYHGIFLQKAANHLNGNGCPRCLHHISQSETNWLDSLNISQEYRQKLIKIDNKRYRVDAFDPLTNTIYEFYGDYWHGNPKKFATNDTNTRSKKTFGELYKQTIKKEKLFKKNGFNIITIWENDWKLKIKKGSDAK